MVRSSSAGLFARRIGVVSTVVLLAACGAPKSDSSSSTSSSAAGSGTSAAASCDKASLKTKTAGKLTIGTDNPAYEPWFSDNTPSNGKGYESAVAYAIAQELGYTKAEVVWAKVPFNNVITPGPKAFDLDLNQVSITEERRKELVKVAKGKGEDAKVAIRNVRRKAADELKRIQKDGEAGEDEVSRAEKELDKITASHVDKVDVIVEAKEKELMEV